MDPKEGTFFIWQIGNNRRASSTTLVVKPNKTNNLHKVGKRIIYNYPETEQIDRQLTNRNITNVTDEFSYIYIPIVA